MLAQNFCCSSRHTKKSSESVGEQRRDSSFKKSMTFFPFLSNSGNRIFVNIKYVRGNVLKFTTRIEISLLIKKYTNIPLSSCAFSILTAIQSSSSSAIWSIKNGIIKFIMLSAILDSAGIVPEHLFLSRSPVCADQLNRVRNKYAHLQRSYITMVYQCWRNVHTLRVNCLLVWSSNNLRIFHLKRTDFTIYYKFWPRIHVTPKFVIRKKIYI